MSFGLSLSPQIALDRTDYQAYIWVLYSRTVPTFFPTSRYRSRSSRRTLDDHFTKEARIDLAFGTRVGEHGCSIGQLTGDILLLVFPAPENAVGATERLLLTDATRLMRGEQTVGRL
jgi:hypothetical protein